MRSFSLFLYRCAQPKAGVSLQARPPEIYRRTSTEGARRANYFFFSGMKRSDLTVCIDDKSNPEPTVMKVREI